MTYKNKLPSAGTLQKKAFLGKILGWGAGKAADLGTAVTTESLKALAIALPATAAGIGYLLAKATSPKAVSDNAHEYAINALEKETLAQSIRDYEDAKAIAKLKAGKKKQKHHDRFV